MKTQVKRPDGEVVELYYYELEEFCKEQDLEYLRNDDSQKRGINEPPIVVNYFYHEEITK